MKKQRTTKKFNQMLENCKEVFKDTSNSQKIWSGGLQIPLTKSTRALIDEHFRGNNYGDNYTVAKAIDFYFSGNIRTLDLKIEGLIFSWRFSLRGSFKEAKYGINFNVKALPNGVISWDVVRKLFPEIWNTIYDWLEKINPNYKMVREGKILKITDKDSGEYLLCDLKEQTFRRTHKGKLSSRNIKNPAQFFRYKYGATLFKFLPQDASFSILLPQIKVRYHSCRNFGTFLIKMFDHQHLESYISAGVPYNFDILFGYNSFPKPIRKAIDSTQLIYSSNLANLFCSDVSVGNAIFDFIKDKRLFPFYVQLLASNIENLTALVNYYNYDLQTLLQYLYDRSFKEEPTLPVYKRGRGLVEYQCQVPLVGNLDDNSDFQLGKNVKKPNYTANVSATGYSYFLTHKGNSINAGTFDAIRYLRDYARMAERVYGLNAFDKYPKNLKEAHDTTSTLYSAKQYSESERQSFEVVRDANKERFEWKSKEFQVIYPENVDSIIYEGKALKHCVGSYIRYILEGKNHILLLRSREDLSKPLVTVEVSHEGIIKQARGHGNTHPLYEATEALIDWAKKRKITDQYGILVRRER